METKCHLWFKKKKGMKVVQRKTDGTVQAASEQLERTRLPCADMQINSLLQYTNMFHNHTCFCDVQYECAP